METAVRPVDAHAPEASSALLVRFPAALGLTDDGLRPLQAAHDGSDSAVTHDDIRSVRRSYGAASSR
jgi:hypothetical protein